MQATKNRIVHGLIIAALSALVAGCTPPGPKALLDGKRLLEKGDYAAAVARLQTAVTLLSTNAQAWNYLGLAYHQSRQTTNAAAAYQKALALDRNLQEARFNLGCLWLDLNNPEAAKAEFTTYTIRRPNAPEGWSKLGFAQLGVREVTAAEKSFSQSIRLGAQNPDAYNGIGMAQLMRSRPREAAQYFESALKQQPGHRAALLNLARVSQSQLNNPQASLRYYREYLELKPKADDWDEVSAVAASLQKQIAAPQPTKPSRTNVVQQTVSVTPPVTNPPTTQPSTNTKLVAIAKVEVPKPEAARPATAPAPAVTQQTRTKPAEVVLLPPEPVIRINPDSMVSSQVSVQPQLTTSTIPEATQSVDDAVVVFPPPPKKEKSGFFQKLNPMNLFRKNDRPAPEPTPLPSPTSGDKLTPIPPQPTEPAAATPATTQGKTAPTPPPRVQPIQRFEYTALTAPTAGNRSSAIVSYNQGVKMRDAGHIQEAADAFRNAVKEDASFFEAQFNLALAEYQLERHKKSLAAWQVALAIRPDSADARYNFALALMASNYPVDAASELERLIIGNPDDARAHLAAGNLYASQLQDKSRARMHYQRVLEIAPGHPQSSAIHYWLVTNPQ